MADEYGPGGERFKRHSAWRWPVYIAIGIAIIGAALLAYYFRPNLGDITGTNPNFTAETKPVHARIAGTGFTIPANYTRIPQHRAGGDLDEVSLHALLPEFVPYTMDTAAEFDNVSAPDSRVVFLRIHRNKTPYDETARFQNLLSSIENPDGAPGPHGLTAYTFNPVPAYANNDLFTGADGRGGTAVIRCTRETKDNPAPTCLRDVDLGPGLAFSYQFKRAWLADWREIDARAWALVQSFRSAP